MRMLIFLLISGAIAFSGLYASADAARQRAGFQTRNREITTRCKAPAPRAELAQACMKAKRKTGAA